MDDITGKKRRRKQTSEEKEKRRSERNDRQVQLKQALTDYYTQFTPDYAGIEVTAVSLGKKYPLVARNTVKR